MAGGTADGGADAGVCDPGGGGVLVPASGVDSDNEQQVLVQVEVCRWRWWREVVWRT